MGLAGRASVFAAVVLPLVVLSCDSSEIGSPPKVRPSTWHVEGNAIHDPTGRTVILRGVNLSGAHKVKPYFNDFGPSDYTRVRTEWGMNAARFLMVWAAIEPTRGNYDEAYLGELEKRMQWARDAGLWIVLDMHQDLYGEGFLGGDGAPPWTCDEAKYKAFKPATPWFFGYLDKNLTDCFDSLWTNADTRGHLVEAWRRVARRLARFDNILGVDPLNEPHWGSYPVDQFEKDRLVPFYEDVTRAVREAAPHWIVFAEPSAAKNLGFEAKLPKLAADNVVYAPHAYDPTAESGGGFDESRRGAYLLRVADLRAEADALGQGLFLGEYGGVADHPGIVPYMNAAFDAAGAAAASSAYWAYDKSSGYAILTKEGAEKKDLLEALVRPYPERTAGKLLSYAYDVPTKTGTVRFEPDASIDAPTEIVVPARIYPRGAAVECGGCEVEEAPGVVRLRKVPSASPAIVTVRPR
ncbi:MAG: cellulase family glycosylhydrolase [Deltaproteobacteria bacterium]|nr:cellulase family glycosylhydrolase [Deltaproteobacteria bacterium]